MSSLYRCKIRVAYKPYKYDKLIVFEEKQVIDADVSLKWDLDKITANSDSEIGLPQFPTSLRNSRCSVTLSDPYLTGIAWPILEDSRSLYQENSYPASGIMLPQCKEGQDPYKEKCRYYPDINLENAGVEGTVDIYPHLLISYWYDVKGTKFGTDFFFRVVNLTVKHGDNYPTVVLQGEETRSIIFNQTLRNYGFKEGVSFEQALETIIKDMGYTPSFCAADYSKEQKYSFPSTTRLTGVTPQEAMKKILAKSQGNMMSQPIRDYQDKVSVCTRNNVNQGCKIFYLGVGLYETYSLDGVPNTQYRLNVESLNSSGPGFDGSVQYNKDYFRAYSYTISPLKANQRAQKFRQLKKKEFPRLFEPIGTRNDNTPETSGRYWDKPTATPAVVRTLDGENINMFGVSPNGTNSISYLDGWVKTLSKTPGNGRVVIRTNYFIHACGKDEVTQARKCFAAPIYQEVRNLTSVSVEQVAGVRTDVTMGQVIGKSTAEKPDYVRFFIQVAIAGDIILHPDIVYKYAIPEGSLTDQERAELTGDTRSSNATTGISGPGRSTPANLGELTVQNSRLGNKVFIMAGHLDITSSAATSREWEANKYAVQWIEANKGRYGLSDIVETYLSTNNNVTDPTNPNSQIKRSEAAVAAGKHVIEIHHDQPNGKSGVIPPLTETGNTRDLDVFLSKVYGSFGTNWRRSTSQNPGELGIPRTGGTILEVAVLNEQNRADALSPVEDTRNRYYKQVLEPLMLAIQRVYSGTGRTTTPQQGTRDATSTSSTQPVGKVGHTGNSSGPHLHVQWVPAGPITSADVGKYILVDGQQPPESEVTSRYGQMDGIRGGRAHGGIDFSGAIVKDKAVVSIYNGASVAATFSSCTREPDAGCNGGCGNMVDINLPDGKKMRICHLAPGSVNNSIVGSTTVAGGTGRGQEALQSGPTAAGLFVDTTFKGVPRALRIIPGRTILSFITEYENWITNGRPRDIDPGVWIPERFSKFFISECSFKWKGDLRVNVRGVIDWGLTKIETPTFREYLATYNNGSNDGSFKLADYYDYIRSLGDLCYTVGTGKDAKNSCETLCSEVQKVQGFLTRTGTTATLPTGASQSFASAPCTYNAAGTPFTRDAQTMNKIMDALYNAGVRTPAGFAGVLGNVARESGFDPAIVGRGMCEGGASDALGLFQWCASRKTALKNKCGARATTVECQVEFLVEELRTQYFINEKVVEKLNQATTPEQAARSFRETYERSRGDGPDISSRVEFAKQIAPGLKCNRN